MSTMAVRGTLAEVVMRFEACVDDLHELAAGRHALQLALWGQHLAEDLKSLRLLALADDAEEVK